MQAKVIAVITCPTLPALSARVEKIARTEFRIVVLKNPTDSFFAPSELPRFTTTIDPTLYAHPSEVMSSVRGFALDHLHKTADILQARGEL
jgi:hypothetical protein